MTPVKEISTQENENPDNQKECSIEEPSPFTMLFMVSGQVRNKNFVLRGDLSAAIDRSKKHCTIMRYRFLHCSPLISDLELEEKKMEQF